MSDMDLPLLANIQDIRARHYLIQLTPNLETKTIKGKVVIFFEPTSLCERNGGNCTRECTCERTKIIKEDTYSEKEIKKETNTHAQDFIDFKDYSINKSNMYEQKCEKQNVKNEQIKIEKVQSSNNSHDFNENGSENERYKQYIIATKQEPNLDVNKAYEMYLKQMANNSESGISLPPKKIRKLLENGLYDDNFTAILDCRSVEVHKVTEIHCNTKEIHEFLSPKKIRTSDRILWEWTTKDQSPLLYSVESWCLKIQKDNVRQVEHFPQVICISYTTTPKGLSLMWRTDGDGNPCVFTPAASINNRSLLPCQDPPTAMATWQAWITVPARFYVSMTGDECPMLLTTKNPITGIMGGIEHLVCYYYYTTMVVPIATIAIAIGQWEVEEIISERALHINSKAVPKSEQRAECKWCDHYEYPCHMKRPDSGALLPTRLVYPASMARETRSLSSFLPHALASAYTLLGTHPFKRLEVLILPRCFGSLGLASPNLIFLSPIMAVDDPAAHIRLVHEISHTWFGIIIGAQDWTEEWLSEGFATYMEDSLYALAALAHQMNHNSKTNLTPKPLHCNGGGSNAAEGIYAENSTPEGEQKENSSSEDSDESNSFELTPDLLEELSELRAHLRYKNLAAELEHSQEELQIMRPMQGEKLKDETGVNYVKNGMNPEKAFCQVHYLKGYFLLKYLSKFVSRGRFDAMIKHYVSRFHGQLVLSEEFLELVESTFPNLVEQGITKDKLLTEWLHHPGLNDQIPEMYGNVSNNLITQVNNHFTFWAHRMRSIKSAAAKKFKLDNPETLKFPDQVVLLFEHFLELPKIPVKVMEEIACYYNVRLQNADVRHRWCELAIKHNFSDMSEIERYLVADQSMGVYLYGELIISGKKRHRTLAEKVYSYSCKEMDESSRVTVFSMLHGK